MNSSHDNFSAAELLADVLRNVKEREDFVSGFIAAIETFLN
jgi:hypothetical protein